MFGLGKKHILWIPLVALVIMALGPPTQAAYTKVYQFSNATGAAQTSVKATTNGLESVVAQYSVPSGWSPAKIGSVVISGIYNTTLTYGGASLAAATSVTIGWQTADNSCRLRDLRWGGGQVIVPTLLSGVPGGALMFYDYPNPGDLTVIITNDTEGVLDLTAIEYAISSGELSLQDLGSLANKILVELRVAWIDAAIAVLRAEVVYHSSLGELPSTSSKSLLGKLDKAVALKHSGLDAYRAGNLSKALDYWAQAGKTIQSFISEVTTSSSKAYLPKYLYKRWIVDGDGEITTAPQIRDALYALPKGQSLQTLPPLPSGVPLPPGSGLYPAGYVPWPATSLLPGQYTAFVIDHIGEGSGFIMRGSVRDASGFVYLNWIEEGTAEEFIPDTENPSNAWISINNGDVYTKNLAVTLDLHAEDDSGIVGCEVTDASGVWMNTVQPADPNYSGQVAGTLSAGDGIKTVSVRYCDAAGNWSDLCTDSIILDQTAPVLTATATKADGTAYTAGTWTNQDVTVHFEASDAGSGLASVSSDITVGVEGITPSVSGTATDNAGNSVSASFGPIKIDKTVPTIIGSRTPEANAYGWNNTDVTVSFTASDDRSGIASVTPDTVVSAEGAAQSVTGAATDNAGNSSSTVVSSINIDKTPPVVTIALPGTGHYSLNESGLVAAWSASDALSGVAPPSSGIIPIDTSVVGAGLLVVAPAGTAIDNAGNLSVETSAGYSIWYVFGGLLSPYAPPPKDYNVGSSIPLKWNYTDSFGNVQDSSGAAPLISVNPVGVPGAPGSRGLEYDSTTNTWSYNWQTDGLAAGIYHIEILSTATGQIDGPFYIQLRY